ncbi:type II secretion system protein [Echinimonas agarilytica]|uniref:type II secretion system protein n=1 Tax=Echinimonas agarilytica TaxID=1215918 RepID=UPI0025582494|nr:type II secretion system protein [Echinimonas agarilytica]
MKIQRGFTLIELVVVIVILGILAVSAAPRFINIQNDARASTIAGMKGTIVSMNDLVYSKAILEGKDKLANSVVNGVPIKYGYIEATRTALNAALQITDEDWVFTPSAVNPNSIEIRQKGAEDACMFNYTNAGAIYPPQYTNLPDASSCN